MSRTALTLLTLVMFGPAAGGLAAQQFSDFDWGLVGTQWGDTTVSGNTVTIESTDLEGCDGYLHERYTQTVVPVDGRVTFTAQWTNFDFQRQYDAPIAVHNGELIFPPGDAWPSGDYAFTLDVLAGDAIGFGAWSDDCQFGEGVAVVADFLFTPRAWILGEGGVDPRPWFDVPSLGAGEEFGGAVAAMSDLDGDGLSELLVGEPDAGRAYVLRGVDGGVLFTASGPVGFGTSVADAGDADGDGTPDWFVGSPFESGEAGEDDAGRVEVRSGADGSLIYDRRGIDAGQQLGRTASKLGNVNADAFDDVLAGRANGGWILAGPDGALLASVSGRAVAGVDDMNGDGVPDVVASGDTNNVTETWLELRSGADTDAVLWRVTDARDTDLPTLARVGDIDGDGVGEVLWGMPTGFVDEFPFEKEVWGRVSVRSGSVLNQGAVIHEWTNAADIWAVMGEALAGGDVTGDGVPDVAFSLRASTNGYLARRVAVMSGATGELAHQLIGPPESLFGRAIAITDDLSGDGVSDLAVGAQRDTGLRVFHALDGGGAPRFLGQSGALVAGAPFTLELSRARANAAAFFVLGLTAIDLPFKGGLFVPEPLHLLALTTDGLGGAERSFVWPAGLPEPFAFWTQAWIDDPDAAFGFSASDGLSGATPTY